MAAFEPMTGNSALCAETASDERPIDLGGSIRISEALDALGNENLKTVANYTYMETVKCIPIPDRKSTDRFGNPQRWILKVVEPSQYRGLVIFPQFKVEPNREYMVDIIRRGKNYAIGQLHQHVWEVYSTDEDPYVVKTVMRCRCGAWQVERKEKFHLPLVEDWKKRWYVQHAIELQRQSHELIKNAPPRRYLYIAVRDGNAVEKLFAAMKRKTPEEAISVVCESHEVTIYDDEAGKYRTLEAWRGAKDKSWICSDFIPVGYIAVAGWVDRDSFDKYSRAKEESEELWRTAEEILGQRIDVGHQLNGQRYVSRLASFL